MQCSMVLRQFGVHCRLVEAIKRLQEGSKSVWGAGTEREYFQVRVCLKQGCIMSLWLFSMVFKSRVMENELRGSGVGSESVTLEGESEKLSSLVREFGREGNRRLMWGKVKYRDSP